MCIPSCISKINETARIDLLPALPAGRKKPSRAAVICLGMEFDRERRVTVAVRPGGAIFSWPRLFATLEAAFGVCFEPAGEQAGAAASIVLCPGERLPDCGDLADAGVPTLALGGEPRANAEPERLRLAGSDPVDQRIRGLTVLDRLDGPAIGELEAEQDVLAHAGRRPVWTRSRGAAPVHLVSSSLPELEPEQALRDLFGSRSLALIALVQFLREVTRAEAFEPPPLRAAILFDDPNLRWRTYGYIDYRQLLAHADAHDYHASMAMIPLDRRHQHRATVELFKRRPDRLSLVLHGNNHVAGELMHPESDAAALAIAAQAMRRAASFEARSGLRMDRVMTPPHGLCSASVARALGALDFDALCAIHPLPWSERTPADRPLAGWDPAEFTAGCAVIPRLPLQAPFEEIALRAFLDQPLILYGHHDDLCGGLDLLAQTASRVNGLGQVRWTSLGEIAASNHASRVEGGVLRVRPYSHRLRLEVPDGAAAVLVESPRDPDRGFAAATAAGSPVVLDEPFAVEPGWLDLRLLSATRSDLGSVPDPAPRVWPILRRAATETRDRLRPLLPAGSA
jgi:hypothetical protein